MAENIKKDKWQVYSTAYKQVGQDLETPGSDTLREHVLKYATYLESYYNQGIDIWPEHCVMYTWGEKLHPFVDEAICQQLWVVGEAESHCVKDTLYDFLHDRPMGINLRTILLIDCMSPVPVTPGPERAEQLRQFCTNNGVRILTVDQLEKD